MDIKSWPWRKRSDKAGIDAPNITHSGKFQDDVHGLSKVLGEHVRMSEEAMSRWQHGEEKIRDLNSKLYSAVSEANLKETTVKQHSKVAEEAVAGWEKAETEAAAMKRQLDAAIEEKSLLQDRILHLDASLKEATRQVRLVREEQEHKRQELLQRKNKELEKLRSENESKLADVGRQLIEAGAENKVMNLTLQEHLKVIAEITDAKSRAETDIKVHQLHIESLEKDIVALNYEVHVLNKEIQIRTEEREYSRRDVEAANRRHSEDVRKISKLETECQKLRNLVRRKLPGPNAVAQMKLEAETLDFSEGNRRRFNGRDVELLAERVLSMEEETKMLKEVLAQRNGELHSSRVTCAKTVSKLSALEAYFDSVSKTHGLPKPKLNGMDTASYMTMPESGDEISCADAWASALIAELSQFKKDKLHHTLKNDSDHHHQLNSPALSVMDDFADMERLASTLSSEKLGDETPRSDITNIKTDCSTEFTPTKKRDSLDLSAKRDEELVSAQKELANLQAKNAANESSFIKLRRNLDKAFEAQKTGGANLEQILEEAKAAIPELEITPEDNARDFVAAAAAADQSRMELKHLIGKIIFVVEALAQRAGMEFTQESCAAESNEQTLNCEEEKFINEIIVKKHWESEALESSIQRLVAFCDGEYEKEKSGVVNLLNEVSGVFDIISATFPSAVDTVAATKNDDDDDVDDLHDDDKKKKKKEDGFKVEVEMLRIEKEALESHMRSVLNKLSDLEKQVGEMQNEKLNLEASLTAAKEEINKLTSKLEEAKNMIEQYKLQEKKTSSSQDVVLTLEKELEEEYSRNHETNTDVHSHRSGDSFEDAVQTEIRSQAQTEANSRKEQEIAEAEEKLAECQRSIHELGKQLKALSSPNHSAQPSLDSDGLVVENKKNEEVEMEVEMEMEMSNEDDLSASPNVMTPVNSATKRSGTSKRSFSRFFTKSKSTL